MESPLRELVSKVNEAGFILKEVQKELDVYPERKWGTINWINSAKLGLKRIMRDLEDIETGLSGTAYFEEREVKE